MKMVFVLPTSARFPVGGYKVVYEYANRLVERGHHITVVHPALLSKDATNWERSRKFLSYFRYLNGDYKPSNWFQVKPQVEMLWVPSLKACHIPGADVVVATAWETAEWVADYPASKGEKYYLIQHKEDWSGPEQRVMATWKLPLRKIVIARWLSDLARDLGEEAAYIPNGLDFTAFAMDVPAEDREKNNIVMLYHELEWKGVRDGMRAIALAREAIPDLELTLFGVSSRPGDLPDYSTYHRNPHQRFLRELYNRSALVVAPSWQEGWGLVPCEGMMSGCAVVATDVGGHREFAINEETALLSPPKQPHVLADNIIRFVENAELRVRLARAGHQYVQRFTWDRAVDSFEVEINKP